VFTNYAYFDSASDTSAPCDKPTDTLDDDIMFALVFRNGLTTNPTTAPAGWNAFGSPIKNPSGGAPDGWWLYWRVASSEGATYTWEWAVAAPTSITIATYRGGFDPADPIHVISNTAYTTSDHHIRAATMNVSSPSGKTLIVIGGCHDAVTVSPPTAPATFTEDVDYDASLSSFYPSFNHLEWTVYGWTGNMDITISTSEIHKHAFAVALNP
jgi:hypothetical protein